MTYKYITENNLYEKQTYMYSEYGGICFLKEYIHSRQVYLDHQKETKSDKPEAEQIHLKISPVRHDLQRIKDKLKKEKWNKETKDLVNAYTKSFEVRKRIYEEYDCNWKPVCGAGFEDGESYLLLAECLLLTYENTRNLKYFSCLLKVDDTVLSIQDKLAETLKRRLCGILVQELNIFYQLAKEKGIILEEWTEKASI